MGRTGERVEGTKLLSSLSCMVLHAWQLWGTMPVLLSTLLMGVGKSV